MDIQQAIEHAREVTKCKRAEATNNFPTLVEYYNECKKCADEHEQLAEWLEELKQYKQLGTLEEVREAVEKQQADKPRIFRLSAHGVPDGYLYSCPNCEYGIIKKDNRGFYSGPRTKYCPDCGKRLDWSEENEIN